MGVRILFIAAMAGAIASAALGLATLSWRLPLRLSLVLAGFLVSFALAKVALVVDALQKPPSAPGGLGRIQAFGSQRLLRLWLAYKVVAALVALGAAAYLATAGAAVVDRFLR